VSIEHPGLEYASRGLIGCLTPQANTTVEPELSLLLPAGVGFLCGRLTSSSSTLEARLLDYGHNALGQISQFANAPLDVVALAITASSYLLAEAAEEALVAEDALITRVRDCANVELVTAAGAIAAALGDLEAKSIALISPYSDSLTKRGIAYWRARGFTIRQVIRLKQDASQFHPIYAMRSSVVTQALHDIRVTDEDAIVVLGTGVPTLASLVEAQLMSLPPVISSMFCLAWNCVATIDRGCTTSPGARHLVDWLRGDHWATRLAQVTAENK
jgi:maleate isomerase